MTTTAIFAEILIVGIVAIAACLGVIASAIGLDLSWLQAYKDWSLGATLGVIALAYPLGIAFDRISDSAFKRVEKPLIRPKLGKLGEEEMRFRVWAAAPDRTISFLDYARSRRRVARSVCLVSFVAVLAALVLGIYLARIDWRLVLLGVLFASIAGWSWWRIGRMYYPRLLLAYEICVLNQLEGAGEGLGG